MKNEIRLIELRDYRVVSSNNLSDDVGKKEYELFLCKETQRVKRVWVDLRGFIRTYVSVGYENKTTLLPQGLVCVRSDYNGHCLLRPQGYKETYIWGPQQELLVYEESLLGNWWDKRVLDGEMPYATNLQYLEWGLNMVRGRVDYELHMNKAHPQSDQLGEIKSLLETQIRHLQAPKSQPLGETK